MPPPLSKILRELAKVPSRASRSIADNISKEIQKGFDRGRDPYGKKWAKLAPATLAKGRFPPPLTDTRLGRSNVTVSPTQYAGIKLSSTIRYMDYHLTGTKFMPRRTFFPDHRGVPDRWKEIFAREISKAYKRKSKRQRRGRL